MEINRVRHVAESKLQKTVHTGTMLQYGSVCLWANGVCLWQMLPMLLSLVLQQLNYAGLQHDSRSSQLSNPGSQGRHSKQAPRTITHATASTHHMHSEPSDTASTGYEHDMQNGKSVL